MCKLMDEYVEGMQQDLVTVILELKKVFRRKNYLTKVLQRKLLIMQN